MLGERIDSICCCFAVMSFVVVLNRSNVTWTFVSICVRCRLDINTTTSFGKSELSIWFSSSSFFFVNV